MLFGQTCFKGQNLHGTLNERDLLHLPVSACFIGPAGVRYAVFGPFVRLYCTKRCTRGDNQYMSERYCPNCEQCVKPEKKSPMERGSWVPGILVTVLLTAIGFFLLGPLGAVVILTLSIAFGLIVGGVGGIIAGISYATQDPHCPICGTENLWESKELYEKSKENIGEDKREFLGNQGGK